MVFSSIKQGSHIHRANPDPPPTTWPHFRPGIPPSFVQTGSSRRPPSPPSSHLSIHPRSEVCIRRGRSTWIIGQTWLSICTQLMDKQVISYTVPIHKTVAFMSVSNESIRIAVQQIRTTAPYQHQWRQLETRPWKKEF